jgi:hypothetical protein
MMLFVIMQRRFVMLMSGLLLARPGRGGDVGSTNNGKRRHRGLGQPWGSRGFAGLASNIGAAAGQAAGTR